MRHEKKASAYHLRCFQGILLISDRSSEATHKRARKELVRFSKDNGVEQSLP
jgi:hypothetical protein